jgi:hypothetical protein
MKVQYFTLFESRLEASEFEGFFSEEWGLPRFWHMALVQDTNGVLTAYNTHEIHSSGIMGWSAQEKGNARGLKFITPGKYSWEEAESKFGLGFLRAFGTDSMGNPFSP